MMIYISIRLKLIIIHVKNIIIYFLFQAKLPVLFYISGDLHTSISGPNGISQGPGGGQGQGSGQENGHSNSFNANGPSGYLAATTNMIFISFSYRLGPLGFLAVDIVSNDGPMACQGNNGVWDMITALEWVQNNIVHFGGDPNNVIVFGGSAAVQMGIVLLKNQQFDRLFSSLWWSFDGQNDNFNDLKFKTFNEVSRETRKSFLRRSNCSTVDCLKNINSEDLIRLFYEENRKSDSLIVVDGKPN